MSNVPSYVHKAKQEGHNYIGLLGNFMANILKIQKQGHNIVLQFVFTNISSKQETSKSFLCCFCLLFYGSESSTANSSLCIP
jgi:hypothetical protein